ncbi:MAG: M23 family metallopeptidase [Bacteroidales bacterium]|nr:M23 family metallopeptidase [Bacteroidales bacterium]
MAYYKYNDRLLSYEKIEYSLIENILRISLFILIIFLAGFIFMIIWLHFFPSAKEKQLMQENIAIRKQYKTLNEKCSQMEKILKKLENNDNNIYRMVFETKPIPTDVRDGGFGGINKYSELQAIPNMDIAIQTSKRIECIMKKTYIQSLSYDTIITLAQKKKEMLLHIPMLRPLKTYRFSSGFGLRNHPIKKTPFIHSGLDLSAPEGSKIYATGNGIVKSAKYENGYGYTVVIYHGYQYHTRYAHCSKLLVKEGQKVKRGEIIALVGNTGLSTGPHLHYEVVKNGQKIDPINLFLTDLSTEEFEEIRKLTF